MLRLLLLKWKRAGLRRERARLHQMAAGIRWELDRNEREAIECEKQIAGEQPRRPTWRRAGKRVAQ